MFDSRAKIISLLRQRSATLGTNIRISGQRNFSGQDICQLLPAHNRGTSGSGRTQQPLYEADERRSWSAGRSPVSPHTGRRLQAGRGVADSQPIHQSCRTQTVQGLHCGQGVHKDGHRKAYRGQTQQNNRVFSANKKVGLQVITAHHIFSRRGIFPLFFCGRCAEDIKCYILPQLLFFPFLRRLRKMCGGYAEGILRRKTPEIALLFYFLRKCKKLSSARKIPKLRHFLHFCGGYPLFFRKSCKKNRKKPL